MRASSASGSGHIQKKSKEHQSAAKHIKAYTTTLKASNGPGNIEQSHTQTPPLRKMYEEAVGRGQKIAQFFLTSAPLRNISKFCSKDFGMLIMVYTNNY